MNNLKSLEKKIFISYHQEGLIEIFLGLIMLTFSLGMLWDFAAYSGSIVVLGTPIWFLIKRNIVVPRIGFVRFQNDRKKPIMFILFLGVLILLLVFILGYFRAISPGSGILDLLTQHYMIIIALVYAIPCLFLGVFLHLRRMYIFSILTLVIVSLGSFLNLSDWLPLGFVAIVILITGIYTFIRFLQNNPLPDQEQGI